MAGHKKLNVALVGNPNAGKTSLFNQLTGMNQKVGNFPGVTMDKKSGSFRLSNNRLVNIIDLPGTYSIYPRSNDERIVFDVLVNTKSPDYPDVIVVIVDASNLERNLLLFTQIRDFGLPTILALNMMDIADKDGYKIDLDVLSNKFGADVVQINARNGSGIDELKVHLDHVKPANGKAFFDPVSLAPEIITKIRSDFNLKNNYQAYQYAQQTFSRSFLSNDQMKFIADLKVEHNFCDRQFQTEETVSRYKSIRKLLGSVIQQDTQRQQKRYSSKLDKILTHKFYGYLIFLVILFLLFQSIFKWAEPFMDMIDYGFAQMSQTVRQLLPVGPLTNLLVEGVIPGLGGVLIFIPQIALLFCFISILEESGYMARVVFLMDKIMRKFGLSGKSVVPLISGVACAIPAIMATRNIESWKDRLITIFVTPFMSCSARLPVYAILIALVIPDESYLGIFNMQGIALMGMYLLGFLMALVSALAMKFILKTKERGYFIMELPSYKWPRWKNVALTIYEKSRTFVLEAGKVILAISIILWVLASYGPGDAFDNAELHVSQQINAEHLDPESFETALAAYKLEHSYAGTLGKWIEPAIRPLGYDWKIGIALITSFAAREVFVGTIATIYSVGTGDQDDSTLKNKLKAERNPFTGGPMYTFPLGMSLMIFYAFAMQCMSTLAVVYRETKGWKWPFIQLVYMSGIAYITAFIVYQLLK